MITANKTDSKIRNTYHRKVDRYLKICRLILPYIGLLIAMWSIFKDGLRLELLLPTYAFTILTGVGFTVGYHRLFAHRSFETIQPVRIVLAILGLMGAHLTVTEYAAVHRCHHAYSDRVGDPHSPRLDRSLLAGLWYAHTGWLFDSNLDKEGKTEKYAPDLIKDRAIATVDKLHLLWVILGLILPAVLGLIVFQSWQGALDGLIWWGLGRMWIQDQIEFLTRGVAHYWGDRDFDTKDYSTNHWIALFSLGEWHNNHHAFPHSANQGFKPWQIDTSYLIIVGLEKLGLARNVKRVSPQEIVKNSI